MSSLLALAASLAVGLSLASAGDLAPVTVPDLSLRVPPSHRPIPLWLDGGNLVLGETGLQVGTLTGTSMEPFVTSGQRLIWRPALALDVRLGDILVADESGCPLGASLAAHQVVSISTETGQWEAQTMWANGRHRLCKVTAERVKGIAVGVIWAGG